MGAGTKQAFGRAVVTMGSVLDVSGLSGIVSYQPEELIITAKPGTPVAEIEAALAQKGQRLGFDPSDWGPLLGREPGAGTIGGAISCDLAGSARIRCGAVRDHLLGLRGVNGLGEAFKAGGKVVKNVTGFDLPKLVCGAFGTLCVLTEVTLRVFPKPPLSTTLMVRGLPAADGFALLRKVWSSPLEATGLAFSHGNALIRLEGEEQPLAEKCAMLRSADSRARNDAKSPEGEVAFRAHRQWRCVRRFAVRRVARLRATGRSCGRSRETRSTRRYGWRIGPAGCCGLDAIAGQRRRAAAGERAVRRLLHAAAR